MRELRVGQRVFIDGRGELWPDLESLCSEFQIRDNVPDLETFIIQSMGYVRLIAAHEQLKISLRPSNVSGPTLAGLFFVLGANPLKRCTVQIYSNSNEASHMLLPKAGSCARLLEDLVTAARTTRTEVLNQRNLSAGEATQLKPLMAALEYWRGRQGRYDELSFRRLLIHDLGARFVRFARSPQSDAFSFKQVGDGLPPFAVKTLRGLIGRHTEEHPDDAYGQACANAYAESIARWEPRLEEIEARAYWPEHGRIRRRYARLILPFVGADDVVEVLSATLPSDRYGTYREAV